MKLRKWEDLPEDMKTEEVKEYYQILSAKRGSLVVKRVFDITLAIFLLILFSPLMLILSILIVIDSPGGVFFRQERVTAYGERFRIHKFRTMVKDADKKGTQVTIEGDSRITRVGKLLRGCRLDELPQLLDVLSGNMSFVGTRPEVPKYAEQYTNEMKATLLLPAGITSQASIQYKDEARLLDGVEDVDAVYIERVLPEKMKYNLEGIQSFGVWKELGIMLHTVKVMIQKS